MELPLDNKKKRITDIYHTLDQSQKHHAEQKKPDTQRLQFNFFDILGKAKLEWQEAYLLLPIAGGWGNWLQMGWGNLVGW